jgi:hypothetical protein
LISLSVPNITNSNKMTSPIIKQLEVTIPKDKFNDTGYIFKTLMTVSLDVLHTIAENSELKFIDLIKQFLPDIEQLDDCDGFLSNWNITLEEIKSNSQKTEVNPENISVEVPSEVSIVTNENADIKSSEDEHITTKSVLKIKIPKKASENVAKKLVITPKETTLEVKSLEAPKAPKKKKISIKKARRKIKLKKKLPKAVA